MTRDEDPDHHPFKSISFMTSHARTARLLALILVMSTIDARPDDVIAEPAPDPVVFVTHWLERGDPGTQPRPDQVRDTVAIAAAPGEYEPATVSIRSVRPHRQLRLEVAGDLTTETGDRIDAAAVTIRLADPFESWTKKQDIEQFLLRTDTVDLAGNATRRFWLTVHVPVSARPGTYRTKLIVGVPTMEPGPDLGRLQTLKALTLELRVRPLRLLDAHETGMAYFMYNNTGYYAKLPGGAETFVTPAYQKRVFEDMRRHGMTTATLYIYPVVQDRFTLTESGPGHLGFAPTMDLLAETGLVAPGLPVIWLGAGAYEPEVWTQVLDERRRRGWPEIVIYGVDEPGEEDRNKRVRAFMGKFEPFRRKRHDDPVRLTTALGSSQGIQTVGHYFDLWIGCMGQRIGESGVIADARMHRKELWAYDCMLAPVDAETDRYYFGVWAWVSQVKGCAHWCYFDAMPKLSYVYPAEDELIPTVGWEAVREGIDDYRYLATLKRQAQRAAEAGRDDLAQGAEAVFAQARAMVTMDNYGRAFLQVRGGDGEASAYHRPRVEPDLPLGAYDALRRAAAVQAAAIAAALTDPP